MATPSQPSSTWCAGPRARLILRTTLVIGAALLAALATAGASRAHEGPATDVLEKSDVFLPIGGEVPDANARRLNEAVRRARDVGYRIKVAVISEPADLGEVFQFWKRPQSYARFLGHLLRLDYRDDLLIVMPAGLGLTRDGRDAARVPLRHVRVGQTPATLTDSATAAVAALARASGHPIRVPQAEPATERATGENRGHDRLIIAIVATLLIALVFAAPVLRRRRARAAR